MLDDSIDRSVHGHTVFIIYVAFVFSFGEEEGMVTRITHNLGDGHGQSPGAFLL